MNKKTRQNCALTGPEVRSQIANNLKPKQNYEENSEKGSSSSYYSSLLS
jgi:hypothetical protein